MTLSPWLVYLWGLADAVKGTLIGFAVFSAIALALAIITYCLLSDEEGDDAKSLRGILPTWIKRLLIIVLMNFGIEMVIPSSKTIAIMVIAPAIVNSDPIQKDLPEIYNAAVDALKEQLKK